MLHSREACRVVDFLSAPGFAKVVENKDFADITGSNTIFLKMCYSTPGYKGSATDIRSCATGLVNKCEHKGVTTK